MVVTAYRMNHFTLQKGTWREHQPASAQIVANSEKKKTQREEKRRQDLLDVWTVRRRQLYRPSKGITRTCSAPPELGSAIHLQ